MSRPLSHRCAVQHHRAFNAVAGCRQRAKAPVDVHLLDYEGCAQMECLCLMAKNIAVSQSTSGDMPDDLSPLGSSDRSAPMPQRVPARTALSGREGKPIGRR